MERPRILKGWQHLTRKRWNFVQATSSKLISHCLVLGSLISEIATKINLCSHGSRNWTILVWCLMKKLKLSHNEISARCDGHATFRWLRTCASTWSCCEFTSSITGTHNNRKQVWDQYYIYLADTNPNTPAYGMAYFQQEFTSFKRDIKAVKNPNTDLKKRHIIEWQSQLLDAEPHLRRLGQLPSLELNIKSSKFLPCYSTVSPAF